MVAEDRLRNNSGMCGYACGASLKRFQTVSHAPDVLQRASSLPLYHSLPEQDRTFVCTDRRRMPIHLHYSAFYSLLHR